MIDVVVKKEILILSFLCLFLSRVRSEVFLSGWSSNPQLAQKRAVSLIFVPHFSQKFKARSYFPAWILKG